MARLCIVLVFAWLACAAITASDGQAQRQVAPRNGLGIAITSFPDSFNAVATRQRQTIRAVTRDCGAEDQPAGRTRTCMFALGVGLVAVAAAMPDHRTLRSVEVFLEARGATEAGPVELLAAVGILTELAEPLATPASRRAAFATLFPAPLSPRAEATLGNTYFARMTMPGIRTIVSVRPAADRPH